jgi:hypothetical protein
MEGMDRNKREKLTHISALPRVLRKGLAEQLELSQ